MRVQNPAVPDSTSPQAEPISIQYLRLDSLTPDPKNARLHSKRQIKQVAASIKEFGFTAPILIDGNGQVVAGHCRQLAAALLGLTEVPTVTLAHLSKAQVRAYMIADNKLTENSTWDEDLLAEALKDLSLQGVDLSLTGFDLGEIDFRIEKWESSLEIKPAADEGQQNAANVSVSRSGDLGQLGKHRVLCGNSLEAESYVRLMGSKKASAVFTDPPFNVPVLGHVTGNGSVQHREFAMASGEMTPEQFTEFLGTAFKHMADFSTSGALHYLVMDWRHITELMAAAKGVYSEFKNLAVWSKDTAGMGSMYRSQHELIFIYKVGKGKHRNNVELGRHGRYRTNVWSYPNQGVFARSSEEGRMLDMHPTVKPVALVADAILDCTARGEIVLDAFLGSGTTLMAAERTGRVAYGIELDPLYVDVVVRRFQKMTGQKAVHAETGELFDDRAATVTGDVS